MLFYKYYRNNISNVYPFFLKGKSSGNYHLVITILYGIPQSLVLFSLLFNIYMRLTGEPICYRGVRYPQDDDDRMILNYIFLPQRIKQCYRCPVMGLRGYKGLNGEQQASTEPWQEWVALCFRTFQIWDFTIFGKMVELPKKSIQKLEWHGQLRMSLRWRMSHLYSVNCLDC